MFIQSKDLPVPPEAEVCHASFNEDSTQESTSRRPDIDSITATTIHISLQVALDPIWDALVCHGEEPPVGEKWLAMNDAQVEGATNQISK